MKPEELQIGDWIQTDNTPFKVVGFDTSNGEVQSDDWIIKLECCNPIPLTPEILEKNGFVDASGKKLKYEYESFNKDVQLNYLTKYSVFSIYIKNEKDNYLWGLIRPNEWYKAFEGEIKYVHDLQHALKICGISKEIIL